LAPRFPCPLLDLALSPTAAPFPSRPASVYFIAIVYKNGADQGCNSVTFVCNSADGSSLFVVSTQVEDDCPLTSVDEIAGAAHQIVEKINEEQGGGSLE
jgi:hypothetical protein